MNVCLPYLTLEDIMDKLNTKYWYSTMQDKDEQQYVDAIETLISKAPIPMKAVLGNSTISVSDFSGLQVGDIIRLDTKSKSGTGCLCWEYQKIYCTTGFLRR